MARILIIDDDELLLSTFTDILSEKGHAVVATADGPCALELYRSDVFDLVLVDLGLPSMSGLDVLREIRRLDERAKVIVISGYEAEQHAAEAKRLGAFTFVQKSAGLKAFLGTVELALSGPLK